VPFVAQSRCRPGGVPGQLIYPFEPLYFIQMPNEVWMRFSRNMSSILTTPELIVAGQPFVVVGNFRDPVALLQVKNTQRNGANFFCTKMIIFAVVVHRVPLFGTE